MCGCLELVALFSIGFFQQVIFLPFCYGFFSAGFSPGGGGPPPPKFVLLRIWPPAHWCIILFLLMMTFVACTAGLITVI